MRKRAVYHFLLTLVLLLGVGCGSNPDGDSGASGQAAYPNKTVTIVCPWAPGGGTDRLARFMADQLQMKLGKPFVVVNQTGGGGAVGHLAGAAAKADGHTLTMGTFELSTMHWMGISDIAWNDFTPVAQINADAAAIVVRADARWNSLADFVEDIGRNPGAASMSGTATGGVWDLARAGFQLAAGLPVESVRWIPSKGAAPSIVELLGGHIDAVCCSIPEAIAQIEAGELKALAVMSPDRLAEYPGVPTLEESGIVWSALGWRGILAPKKTPDEIVDSLAAACSEIVASESFKTFMSKNGFSVQLRSEAEFAEFLEAQDKQWKSVIEAVGYSK